MAPIGDADELQRIIERDHLTSVFQPIVDLQQISLYGYEALIRGPANSTLHSPLSLFDTAGRHGLLAPLENACCRVSSRRFRQFGAEGKLFLNVSPMSLTERDYTEELGDSFLNRLGMPPERIVIELSEQYPLDNYELLRTATEYFRAQGFEIAIDDLGSGYAGLRAWSELRPDYVKIDRHFIEDIHRDSVKREFVRSIQEIAKELGCKVIAEGIETSADLDTVQSLGIVYGQGYFLGRPETSPEKESVVLERAKAVCSPQRRTHRVTQPAATLALTSPTVASNVSLQKVSDIFRADRLLSCLPIVDHNRPVGMVDRQEILELFAHQYTRELHGRKPIGQFMNRAPLIVPDTMPIEEVSRQLTSGTEERLAQDFIITRDGEFYGIGKTANLLRRITEQQIRNARYANPLTLLPGAVPIHEHIEELLKARAEFRMAYFDINHFKPFNDHYGYHRGDDVIVGLAQLLNEHAHPQRDFVGHIGGDDFVLVLSSEDWEARCQQVLEGFSERISRFYCDAAIAEGGIWGQSRNGDEQFFRLLSLAVGVAHPDPEHCKTYHDVAALAVAAKLEAKQQHGNALFINRRRRPDGAPVEAAIPLP